MAILDIRVYGDPVLRQQTKPITEITDDIRQLVADMFETMYAAEGLGLAAPQVGKSLRLAIMDVEDVQYVMINPTIMARSGSERAEEGCLSIPELFGMVERPACVTLRATNLDGEDYELEADGLLARCIQHEVDHLDGRLYVDYLSVFKRKTLLKQWEHEAPHYPNFIRKVSVQDSTAEKAPTRSDEPASN